MKVLVTQLCLTLCDPMICIAHQTPLSMKFSRQEYWSGLPGDLPNPGIEPECSASPALACRFFTLEPSGKPTYIFWSWVSFPPPGDCPNPEIKPASLVSPALAGRFFATGTTWEARSYSKTSLESSIMPHHGITQPECKL